MRIYDQHGAVLTGDDVRTAVRERRVAVLWHRYVGCNRPSLYVYDTAAEAAEARTIDTRGQCVMMDEECWAEPDVPTLSRAFRLLGVWRQH